MRKSPFPTPQDPTRPICRLSSPGSYFGSCCKRASRRFADCKFAHGGAAPLSPAAVAAVADSAVAPPARPSEVGPRRAKLQCRDVSALNSFSHWRKGFSRHPTLAGRSGFCEHKPRNERWRTCKNDFASQYKNNHSVGLWDRDEVTEVFIRYFAIDTFHAILPCHD